MITRKDVEHVARLARVALTEAEAAAFEGELAAILDFAAKLDKAGTESVAPLTGGTSLENVMRPDEIQKPEEQNERGAHVLQAAPRKRDSYVEVPAVFERE